MEQRTYTNILDAFRDVRRAALLGAPGAGKTTTLRKLAVKLAETAQADPEAPLPLLVRLDRWANGVAGLLGFVGDSLPALGPAAVEKLTASGRAVLLLDGLNELPPVERARKVQQILDVEAAGVFVSCREEDYTDNLRLGLDELRLEPLTPPQVREALRKRVTRRGEQVEAADRMFWDLAGDQLLAGVLQKWLDAGATETEFWTVKAPQEQKAAYGKTSGEDDLAVARAHFQYAQPDEAGVRPVHAEHAVRRVGEGEPESATEPGGVVRVVRATTAGAGEDAQ